MILNKSKLLTIQMLILIETWQRRIMSRAWNILRIFTTNVGEQAQAYKWRVMSQTMRTIERTMWCAILTMAVVYYYLKKKNLRAIYHLVIWILEVSWMMIFVIVLINRAREGHLRIWDLFESMNKITFNYDYFYFYQRTNFDYN